MIEEFRARHRRLGPALQFDHRTGAGVVLHMLSGLAIEGRFGLTAIARSPDEAEAVVAKHAAQISRVDCRG